MYTRAERYRAWDSENVTWAYMWFTFASRQGITEAQRELEQMQLWLHDEGVAAGETMVRDYTPVPCPKPK